MDKIKLEQAVIVEGKYDKIKLSSLLDAVIIVTNGFGIYKNPETVKMIRFYAAHSGIIILTDSDTAGLRIRGHIKSIVPNGKIINLYTPEIFGKEKRKAVPSKEGKLGVEGISADILRNTFERAGILESSEKVVREPVTKQDFYVAGLSGNNDSSQRRCELAKKMGVPLQLSAAALRDAVNTLYSRDEFLEMYGVKDKKE